MILTTIPIVAPKGHRDIASADTPLPAEPRTEADSALLERKLALCALLPDFSNPEADRDAKMRKSALLEQLSVVFGKEAVIERLPDPLIDAFFAVVGANVFRGIPPTGARYLVGDEMPYVVDVAWLHLAPVYGLLLAFFAARPADPRVLVEYERRVLYLFRAPDANERDQVLCFFRCYLQAHPDREPHVMGRAAHMLTLYREGVTEPYAVTPILVLYQERFGAATGDKRLPRTIVREAVIPLISGRHIVPYYRPLADVFALFAEHEPEGAVLLAMEAIRRFPEPRPAKQLLLINLITFLTEKVTIEDFTELAEPLLTLYARCATTGSARVADASFKVWGHVHFIPVILENTRAIFRLMHPALVRAMKGHWNPVTQNAALNSLKSMHDIDPFLFDELSAGKKGAAGEQPPSDTSATHKHWATVARIASKRDRTVNLTKVLADVQCRFSQPRGKPRRRR